MKTWRIIIHITDDERDSNGEGHAYSKEEIEDMVNFDIDTPSGIGVNVISCEEIKDIV